MNKKVIVCAIILLMLVYIRIIPLGIQGPDYVQCLSNWYEQITQNGKIDSLGMQIGNYTPPYIYLLTLGTYITSNSLIWIKFISCLFDFILAFTVYKIAKHYNVNIASRIFYITLLLPGVILNSAVLGQCDSIYTTFVMLFFYSILKNRNKLALTFLGVALSFKLQAIFIIPILIYLILTKKIKWNEIIFVAIGFVVMMVPAMVYGKGLIEIVKIYTTQTSTYPEIVRSAPNIYSALGLNYMPINILVKYGLSLIGVVLSIYISIKDVKNSSYSDKDMLIKTMLLSLIVPFVLPGMMDRYFYMANIFILMVYYIIEWKNTDILSNSKQKNEFKRIVILASIAYVIPVFTINFIRLSDYIMALGDTIGVSLISAILNTYIIYFVTRRYIFTKKTQEI